MLLSITSHLFLYLYSILIQCTLSAFSQRYTEGWIQYFTEEGVPYYYNETSQDSVWEMPEGYTHNLFHLILLKLLKTF